MSLNKSHDPMNLDNPIITGAQIDGSSVTPSPPNNPHYAYMFTFLKNKIDHQPKQTDKLRNENVALRFTIDKLNGSNGIAKRKLFQPNFTG